MEGLARRHGHSWRTLCAHAEARLGSPLDARRIVERASGYEGADLLVALDRPAPERAVPFVLDMIERRAAGEPLQYVVGRWGFRHLDLLVDRRVLIPRPETEFVVEVALRQLARQTGGEGGGDGGGRPAGGDSPAGSPPAVVVDLGTGSGAIALAVASEWRHSRVWATDASADALAVARANLAGLGSQHAFRVRLAEGRWYDALPGDLRGQVDLIVSNPPYIADAEHLPAEVADWEPRQALFAGPTGLEAIAEVVAGAPAWLRRPGAVVVEVAPHQASQAADLARASGFGDVDVVADLQGRLRVLIGTL